jgi:hypothetical protein
MCVVSGRDVVLVIDSDSPFLRGGGVTGDVASEVTWWSSGAELVETFVVEGDVHELVDTLVVEEEVALEVDDGGETWWWSGAELVETFVVEGEVHELVDTFVVGGGDAIEVDDGGELNRGAGVVNRRAGALVVAGARVVV